MVVRKWEKQTVRIGNGAERGSEIPEAPTGSLRDRARQHLHRKRDPF